MALMKKATIWCLFLLVLVNAVQSQRPCDPTTTIQPVNVREDQAEGALVGELTFVGPDITASAQDHEYLRYDGGTGKIFLKKTMDAETSGDPPNLKIICTDDAGTRVSYSLKILVEGVNEFEPVFEKDVYEVRITEAATIGTVIEDSIVAIDKDKTTSNVIKYSILPGENSNYFEIPVSNNGKVVIKEKLEFDDNILITLTIKAQDSESPPKSSTCKLKVTVDDVDDEPPIFSDSQYTGSIAADAPMETTVTLGKAIVAADGDKGINAPVEYKIQVIPGVTSYFSIESSTGVLRLSNTKIRAGEKHIIMIRAQQVNEPTRRFAQVPLVVTVVGSGSANTQLAFTKPTYQALMPENQPPGSDILTVHAQTADKYQAITYSILQEANHPQFEIDGNRGTIRLQSSAKLDYEKVQKYEFTVRATAEQAGIINSTTSTVVIDVLNINDNDPKFTQDKYNFKIQNLNSPSTVGTVRAEDPDGDQCDYSVKSYNDIFAISQSGELRFKVNKNQIKQGSFVFVVACTDRGDPPRQGTATVDVMIGNGTAPVISAGSSGSSDLIPLLVLAVLCGILLFIIIILVIYIQRRGSQLKREKAHKQNISNLSIFGDSSSNLNDDGATTVQENPLALENPGYFYMMKSDTDNSYSNDYLVSEVRYPNDTAFANGSTFTENGSSPRNGGKRVKIQNDQAANGQPPKDSKLTVYF